MIRSKSQRTTLADAFVASKAKFMMKRGCEKQALQKHELSFFYRSGGKFD